jgi:hypothetical protein
VEAPRTDPRRLRLAPAAKPSGGRDLLWRVATLYSVICRADLSAGMIVRLREMGLYRVAVADSREPRHEFHAEAGSPDDAILRVRGAIAVVGGEGFDYRAEPAQG